MGEEPLEKQAVKGAGVSHRASILATQISTSGGVVLTRTLDDSSSNLELGTRLTAAEELGNW